MAVLEVEGQAVPVRPPLRITRERVSPVQVTDGGRGRAVATGGPDWHRVIRVQTDPALATLTAGVALRDALTSPGIKIVRGDALGVDVQLECYARNIIPTRGPGSDMMPQSFELHEAGDVISGVVDFDGEVTLGASVQVLVASSVTVAASVDVVRVGAVTAAASVQVAFGGAVTVAASVDIAIIAGVVQLAASVDVALPAGPGSALGEPAFGEVTLAE